MKLDPLLISRLQFGFTIKFQIIFPTFTIGLNEAPRYLIRDQDRAYGIAVIRRLRAMGSSYACWHCRFGGS